MSVSNVGARTDNKCPRQYQTCRQPEFLLKYQWLLTSGLPKASLHIFAGNEKWLSIVRPQQALRATRDYHETISQTLK